MATRTKQRGQDLREKIECVFSKDWSSHLQMAGLTLLLLTIQIWQIRGYGRLSLSVFLAGIFFLCESSSVAIRCRRNVQRQFQRNTILLLILEIIAVLFLLVNSREIVKAKGIGGEVILVVGLTAAIAAQILQLYVAEYRWKPGRGTLKECLLLGSLCIVIGFLLNIEIFNTWPRWDSYHYFRAFELLSARNIFCAGDNGLVVADHSCISYALWSLLFESIPIPGMTSLNKLYLSNMTAIAIDLVLFYLIFKHLLSEKQMIRNMLFAVIAVGAPWIFGCAGILNQELVLSTGILLLLYSVFKNNYLLSILSAFIVCTARETGPAIAAVIIFIQLLYDAMSVAKKGIKLSGFPWEYYSLCMSVGILWLVQFRIGNWAAKQLEKTQSGVMKQLFMIDGAPIKQFTFSPVHIQDSLVSALIMNFKWIFSGLIILSVILFLTEVCIRKRKINTLFQKKECWIIAAGMVVSLIETCAYVTYNNPRYITSTSVLLSILGLYSLSYVSKKILNKSLIKVVLVAFVGVLLWTQSYLTIDPVTRLLYPKMNIGNRSVVAMPYHLEQEGIPFYSDNAAYNRQSLYFDKALDMAYAKIYEDCGLENTRVLCSNEYFGRDGIGSKYSIWGFGYEYLTPPMWGEWNSEGNYRYLSYEPENIINPGYISGKADLRDYFAKYEHVYYIQMPWGDSVLPALQKRYPDISHFTTIEHRGWILEIYRMK